MILQPKQQKPQKKRVLLGTGIVLTLILCGASLALSQTSALSLANLNGRIYRLQSGPLNQCPDKVGFVSNREGKTLQVYPMEVEWQMVRTNINPLLDMKAIRYLWESPVTETVRVSETENNYSAYIDGNAIVAKVETIVDGFHSFESHARLEINRRVFVMAQWSIVGGAPLGGKVVCRYNLLGPLKSAQ